jgi:hypothetical protein
VATLRELTEEAEEDRRAHIRSAASDDTNYFVSQAADLLAALRLWANTQQRTDADIRSLVDSRSATMLKNIATELAEGGGDDELEASRRLQGIAYGPFRPPERDIRLRTEGPSAELRRPGGRASFPRQLRTGNRLVTDFSQVILQFSRYRGDGRCHVLFGMQLPASS